MLCLHVNSYFVQGPGGIESIEAGGGEEERSFCTFHHRADKQVSVVNLLLPYLEVRFSRLKTGYMNQ